MHLLRRSCLLEHGPLFNGVQPTTTHAMAAAAAAADSVALPRQQQRLRILCLHGFRTSGEILRSQIQRAKWSSPLLELMDLEFLDGPFPATGKSDVEGYFAPPYYEWFSSNKEFSEYYGVEECTSYLANHMRQHGPFDGFLGFSQGGFFASALAGLQANCDLLPTKIKFVILIASGKFRYKRMAAAYEAPIECPSLHMLGDKDFNREAGEALVGMFKEPVLIRHPYGHIVPKLDEENVAKFRSFLLDMLKSSDAPSEVETAAENLVVQGL